MPAKSPRGGNAKKEPTLTLKEKREAKRERTEATLIKPRKSR